MESHPNPNDERSGSPSTPETTVWEGMPSHWRYSGWYILGVLTIPLVVGIGILIWIWLDRSKNKYSVTTRRIIVETGILARSTREVRIQDIRSINVARKGLEGIMGIGTVDFGTAGTDGVEVSFVGIANADAVRKMVNELQN